MLSVPATSRHNRRSSEGESTSYHSGILSTAIPSACRGFARALEHLRRSPRDSFEELRVRSRDPDQVVPAVLGRTEHQHIRPSRQNVQTLSPTWTDGSVGRSDPIIVTASKPHSRRSRMPACIRSPSVSPRCAQEHGRKGRQRPNFVSRSGGVKSTALSTSRLDTDANVSRNNAPRRLCTVARAKIPNQPGFARRRWCASHDGQYGPRHFAFRALSHCVRPLSPRRSRCSLRAMVAARQALRRAVPQNTGG